MATQRYESDVCRTRYSAERADGYLDRECGQNKRHRRIDELPAQPGNDGQQPDVDDEFDVGEQDLRILRGYGVTIETPSWSTVARIKGVGGSSLGDSYAAALALEEAATLVVGAEPEFGDLSADIDLHRIREDPI